MRSEIKPDNLELTVPMEDLPAEFLAQAAFEAEFEDEESERIVIYEEWEVESGQSDSDCENNRETHGSELDLGTLEHIPPSPTMTYVRYDRYQGMEIYWENDPRLNDLDNPPTTPIDDPTIRLQIPCSNEKPPSPTFDE
jgi:hypothetical protein